MLKLIRLTVLKFFRRNGTLADSTAKGSVPPSAVGENHTPYFVHIEGGARVDLVAHARASALENLPETAAREPNDVEAAVQREHERRHRDLVERTRTDLQALAAEFDGLEQRQPVARDLHAAVEQSRANVEHDLASDHALVPLRQEQQRRRRIQREFALAHGLTQPAHYPASQAFHLGIAAVLIVVESLLNMAFFGHLSSLGLVGGFFVAVAISVANVALGLMAGFFCLRWRNHREAWLKGLATAGVVVYALLTLLFNLGAAHLRDQATTSGLGREIQLAQLFHNHFSLTFPSAVLLVAGILASLVAAWKGYTLDSATPGHGEVDRRFKAADRAFNEHDQALRQRTLSHAEGVPEICRAIVRRAELGYEQLGQVVVRVARRLEGYEAERERLERWCHQWLRRYRVENESVRTTRSPAYFSRFPNLRSEVDGVVLAQLVARLQQAGRQLAEIKAESHAICLEQSSRVAVAGDRFEGFLRDALHRADVGRGDGSSHAAHGQEHGNGAGR